MLAVINTEKTGTRPCLNNKSVTGGWGGDWGGVPAVMSGTVDKIWILFIAFTWMEIFTQSVWYLTTADVLACADNWPNCYHVERIIIIPLCPIPWICPCWKIVEVLNMRWEEFRKYLLVIRGPIAKDIRNRTYQRLPLAASRKISSVIVLNSLSPLGGLHG